MYKYLQPEKIKWIEKSMLLLKIRRIENSLRLLKNRRIEKSLQLLKNRRIEKSLRLLKNRWTIESLRALKSLRLVKNPRLKKNQCLKKNRQDLKSRQSAYCLGSAEYPAADFSLVWLMSSRSDPHRCDESCMQSPIEDEAQAALLLWAAPSRTVPAVCKN
jgi:hypothetical protein